MAQVIPDDGAPNSLDGPCRQIMDSSNALLVRQKFDALEAFCAICERKNKYNVKIKQPSFPAEGWSENLFMESPDAFVMKEESECWCRHVFHNKRALKMHVSAGNKAYDEGGTEVFVMDKPCKLTMMCCCFMINPPEITVATPAGATIGTVTQDYRCMEDMCMKSTYVAKDASGTPMYYIKNNLCCNANACAPSFFCKSRKFEIMDATEQNEVGSIGNEFSCNFKRLCFSGVDQYQLTFPAGATAEQKAVLLAANVLLEYEIFEKPPE